MNAKEPEEFDGKIDLLNQEKKEIPRPATEKEKEELLAAARKVKVKPRRMSSAEKNTMTSKSAALRNRVGNWRAKNKAAKKSRKRNRK